MVFAVGTISTVYVYDTQHAHPIARISGYHFAAINDISWSEDGQILSFCSSDGYITFVRFADNILGIFTY
jgi:chromatin assembly factor 1 subunit B